MNGTLATSEVTIRQEPIQYRGPFEGIFNGMVLNAGWPVSTRTNRRYRHNRGTRIARNVQHKIKEGEEQEILGDVRVTICNSHPISFRNCKKMKIERKYFFVKRIAGYNHEYIS